MIQIEGRRELLASLGHKVVKRRDFITVTKLFWKKHFHDATEYTWLLVARISNSFCHKAVGNEPLSAKCTSTFRI